MKVQIVSFHCIVKNKMGKVISSTFNQDILTSSSDQGEHLTGLVHGLQNLTKGEKRRIDLRANEAYGFYDPQMVITVPRQRFSSLMKAKNDSQPLVLSVNGKRKAFRIINVEGDSVTLDGNHPLAGQDLVFEIETTAVRDATPEEISDSHADPAGPLMH